MCGCSHVVAAAIATHHPDLLAAKTWSDHDAWDVRVSHPAATDFTGTSWLDATGDTLAFTAFEDRVCAIAADLATAGDTDPLGARKAKAIGILAGQALEGPEADLFDLVEEAERAPKPDESAPPTGHSRSRPRHGPRTHLYLHFGLADLLGLGADDDLIAGRVKGRGHVLEATLQSWATHSEVTITPVLDQPHDPAAGDQPQPRTVPPRLDPAILEAIASWTGNPTATTTPVLDLNRAWAFNGHDAPAAMREQVIQRDPHCVHPWCGQPARRADLDHTTPYKPMDDGGPPGQTAPHGRHYLVTQTGTTELS